MKEYLVNDPTELNAISALPIKRVSGLGRIRLGGSIGSHPDRHRWERALNGGYFACGCDSSAHGFLLGLVAGLAWSVYSYGQADLAISPAFAITLATAFAGAITGKAYGLAKAESALRRTVREIQTHWKVERPTPETLISCG